ncbi:MAG: hypothetical protein MZV49_09685 [Rhodopseudomonas palustris]|nr:hypothetical protein [Rhodopseudomonas palustris]
MPGVNSDAYLKRLCEVNLITAATPSHAQRRRGHDVALEEFNYDLRGHPRLVGHRVRGADAVGQAHRPHQLHDDEHGGGPGDGPEQRPPPAHETGTSGPRPAIIERGDFATFEEFFDAFTDAVQVPHRQLRRVQQHARRGPPASPAHAASLRPHRRAASQKGRDVTKGGAHYNSSGAAMHRPGGRDRLAHGRSRSSCTTRRRSRFAELQEAIDAELRERPGPACAMVTNKVPRFGSGSDEAAGHGRSAWRRSPTTLLRQPCNITAAAGTPPGSGPCRTTWPSAT